MWNGNKNIVMRATGGGNVIAYNYMDDSYGATYPRTPEAGLNAIGSLETRAEWQSVSNAYETQLRQGNWDWVIQSQIWYRSIGATGSSSNGTPQVIPDSLYLTAKPAFFGSNPWPWVNPSNGTVSTLPAKACLEQGKMPTCMMHESASGRAPP